jgi:hypothetical protein
MTCGISKDIQARTRSFVIKSTVIKASAHNTLFSKTHQNHCCGCEPPSVTFPPLCSFANAELAPARAPKKPTFRFKKLASWQYLNPIDSLPNCLLLTEQGLPLRLRFPGSVKELTWWSSSLSVLESDQGVRENILLAGGAQCGACRERLVLRTSSKQFMQIVNKIEVPQSFECTQKKVQKRTPDEAPGTVRGTEGRES